MQHPVRLRRLTSVANSAVHKNAYPTTGNREWKTQLANGPELQDFIAQSSSETRVNAEEDIGEERKMTTEESLKQIQQMLQQIKQVVRAQQQSMAAWQVSN